MPNPSTLLKLIAALLLASGVLLHGCSSGGSGASITSSRSSAPPVWQQDVYPDPGQLVDRCENPRSGEDPYTGQPYSDLQGTSMHEKMWLRAAHNELYLWTDQVADVSPLGRSLFEYFQALLYPDDKFSFMMDEAVYDGLSTDGTAQSFGIYWFATTFGESSAAMIVADVDSSSALYGNVKRGDQLVGMDNLDATKAENIHQVYDALEYPAPGASHTLTFFDPQADATYTVTATSDRLTLASVPLTSLIETTTGNVGYILFHTHNQSAEDELIDAVTQLQSQGAEDLVLDLRYNSGGALYVASQLSFMIAGEDATQGKTFEQFIFNGNYGPVNPFTGDEESLPFYSTSPAVASTSDELAPEPLPTLGLPRLYVLTTYATCSASESIINALQGIDVEVVQIGDTTCGKPYGGMVLSNCGTAFSMVMFRGSNHKGYGDFYSGFTPTEDTSETNGEANVPGCPMLETFNAPLGSPDETLLAAALHYRDTGSCPESPQQASAQQKASAPINTPLQLHQPDTQEAFINKFRGGKILERSRLE